MTFKEFFRREKHVAMHGQSRRFRVVKWIVILAGLGVLTVWKGMGVAALAFLGCGVAGICLHFFLRYKSKGWTESWGPYKKIKIPLDGE